MSKETKHMTICFFLLLLLLMLCEYYFLPVRTVPVCEVPTNFANFAASNGMMN